MIVFRTDLEEFLIPTVGALRDLLNNAEIPGHYELLWNDVGNLAICEPAPSILYPDTMTRWFVGYVDLARMEVHMAPGSRPSARVLIQRRIDHEAVKNASPFPDQYPFDSDDVRNVDGRCFDANSIAQDGTPIPPKGSG